MDDLLKVKPGRGVVVRDNDLILDPSVAAAGAIDARRRHRRSHRRQRDRADVRQWRRPPPVAAAVAKNYIYWRGGSLSFGKLTMTATDLELVDMDPKDAFDFSVEHWNDQLVAGYSKTTSARGLKAHMPDYNDLAKPSGPGSPKR